MVRVNPSNPMNSIDFPDEILHVLLLETLKKRQVQKSLGASYQKSFNIQKPEVVMRRAPSMCCIHNAIRVYSRSFAVPVFNVCE